MVIRIEHAQFELNVKEACNLQSENENRPGALRVHLQDVGAHRVPYPSETAENSPSAPKQPGAPTWRGRIDRDIGSVGSHHGCGCACVARTRAVVLVLATLATISKFHRLNSKLYPEDSTKRHYMINMRNLNQIKHAGLICMCNMWLVFDQHRNLHGSS